LLVGISRSILLFILFLKASKWFVRSMDIRNCEDISLDQGKFALKSKSVNINENATNF
jgi:hypothetical protein